MWQRRGGSVGDGGNRPRRARRDLPCACHISAISARYGASSKGRERLERETRRVPAVPEATRHPLHARRFEMIRRMLAGAAIVAGVTIGMGAGGARAAEGAHPPDLTGYWRLDPARSS